MPLSAYSVALSQNTSLPCSVRQPFSVMSSGPVNAAEVPAALSAIPAMCGIQIHERGKDMQIIPELRIFSAPSFPEMFLAPCEPGFA